MLKHCGHTLTHAHEKQARGEFAWADFYSCSMMQHKQTHHFLPLGIDRTGRRQPSRRLSSGPAAAAAQRQVAPAGSHMHTKTCTRSTGATHKKHFVFGSLLLKQCR